MEIIKFRSRELFAKEDTYSLRGLCMLAIIVHHIYQFSIIKFQYDYDAVTSNLFQSFGYLGTSVFFLLSGYGLFSSLKKHEPVTWSYVRKHMQKLIAPFLFIWFCDLCLCIIYGNVNMHSILTSLITFGLVGGGNSLWFLKEIIVIYLLLFFVFAITNNDKVKLLTIFILSIIFVFLSAYKWNLINMWWNSVLCFPLGMLCAQNRCRIGRLISNKWKLFVLWSVFFISFLLSRFCQSSLCPDSFIVIAPIPMIISSLLFSISVIGTIRYVKFNGLILDYIGKNSLIFYLAHIFLLVNLLLHNFLLYVSFVIVGTFFISIAYGNIKTKISSLL